MASSSSAPLYPPERPIHKNQAPNAQKVQECEREIEEWKARALQAEAQLVAIKSMIKATPRQDTPQVLFTAATAPVQVPTLDGRSSQQLERSVDSAASSPRNSQLRTPPAELAPSGSRLTEDVTRSQTADTAPLAADLVTQDVSHLFTDDEEKPEIDSTVDSSHIPGHSGGDDGDISTLTDLSSDEEKPMPTTPGPRKRSASPASQGGRFFKRQRAPPQPALQFAGIDVPPPPPALAQALRNTRRLTLYRAPLPAIIASLASLPLPEGTPPAPCVTRRFLCALYGCAEGCLRARIASKPYAPTRLHTAPGTGIPATFATPELNPQMAAAAGAPGILLTRRRDVLFTRPTPLFVGRAAGEWEYVGDYESEVGRALSAEEFKGMEERAQKKWASGIMNMSRDECWKELRATVLGSDEARPNDPEAAETMLNALRNGVVNLKVIVFTCKNYNTDLARDLAEWWPRREELDGLYRRHQQEKKEEKAHRRAKKTRSSDERQDERADTAFKRARSAGDGLRTPAKKPRMQSEVATNGAGPSTSNWASSPRRTPSQRKQKTPPWIKLGFGPAIDDDDGSDYQP
ncbi:hypothetical protein HDZ31DRAFT_33607 [Schizophyllum fasciatum]